MENAADALKITFAVLIFILALAVAFSVIAKARQTGDVVLYHADKTNFYDWGEGRPAQREATIADIVCTLNRIAEGETITVSIIINGHEIVPADLGTDEDKIEDFIDKFLKINGTITANDGSTVTIPNNNTDKYQEQFVEVYYSGMYKAGVNPITNEKDGTVVTVSQGGTREYITYIYI